MNEDLIFEQMKEKAMNAEPLGGTLKFKIDDKTVYIDGSGDTNIISTDDKEADCTISASLEVLMKLKNGEIPLPVFLSEIRPNNIIKTPEKHVKDNLTIEAGYIQH